MKPTDPRRTIQILNDFVDHAPADAKLTLNQNEAWALRELLTEMTIHMFGDSINFVVWDALCGKVVEKGAIRELCGGDHLVNVRTYGLYANGDYRPNIVAPEDLDAHVRYNIENRPGRTLIVNGAVIHRGYADDDTLQNFLKKIPELDKNIPLDRVTRPYR